MATRRMGDSVALQSANRFYLPNLGLAARAKIFAALRAPFSSFRPFAHSPTRGARTFYSLPDSLHVLCYLSILAAFLITLRSRKFNDDGETTKALRWEKRISVIVLAVFVVANFACAWWIIEPNTPPSLAQIVEMGQ